MATQSGLAVTDTGTAIPRVVDTLEVQTITTTLAASAALAATSFTVASSTGMVVGQLLQVDSGTNFEVLEVATVPNGSTFTSVGAAIHAHANGVAVIAAYERQAMVIADPTTYANQAGVTTRGALQVEGVTSGTAFPVTGTFWQATQPVSGTFWQATQPVSLATLPSLATGSNTIGNVVLAAGSALVGNVGITGALPTGSNVIGAVMQSGGPWSVSGTFWQTTQPVSLASLPALATGSNTIGTVNVNSVGDMITGPTTISITDSVVAAPANNGAFVSGASTAGSLVSIADPGGLTAWNVQITGLTSGTLYFEASMDSTTGTDGNWIAVVGRQTGVLNTNLNYFTTVNGLYRGNVSGMKYFRVRSVGALTGTPAIVIRLSEGQGATFLNAGLPPGSDIIGKVGIDQTTPGITNGVQLVTANTTTNLSGLNQTAALQVGPYSGVGVVITGTWSGTLSYQASVDGTNYVTIQNALNATGTNSNLTTQLNVVGYQWFQVIFNSYVSGTATVTLHGDVAAPTQVMAAANGNAVTIGTTNADALSSNSNLFVTADLRGFNGSSIDRIRVSPAGTALAAATPGILAIQGVTNGAPVVTATQTQVYTTIANNITVIGSANAISATVPSAGMAQISIHGTYGIATFQFQGSDDSGITWYPIQGTRSDGSIGEATTGSIPANSSIMWSFGLGGLTNLRIYAVTLASGTVNVRITPVGGSVADPSIFISNALTKGTQGLTGVSTQDLKDSGRQSFSFAQDANTVVTTSTTEAFISATPVVAGTAGSAAAFYTVPAGKTLRLQQFRVSASQGTATAQTMVFRVRQNPGGGTPTTASVFIFSSQLGLPATIGAVDREFIDFPDGFELAANSTFGITVVSSVGVASTHQGFMILGYLY